MTQVLTGAAGAAGPGPWQNPHLSPNPGSNIHNDSYFSDTYPFPGPTKASALEVDQLATVLIADPDTGHFRAVLLGECASQAYDADGNIQTICSGIPNPNTSTFTTSLVTIDARTLAILAYTSYERSFPSLDQALSNFAGAGYFFQDNLFRIVVALPTGHVTVFQRQPSAVSPIDRYVAVRDINVTGDGGAVPADPSGDLRRVYALMPDKHGNIWFTTADAVVGTIAPDGTVRWYDTNDPDGDGTPDLQADGGSQQIANSHAVDEGESTDGPSGVYVVTTYHQYKFQAGADGTPAVAWQQAYDRGSGQKSGQVSWGSGSSPTVFNMGGRRFVTITDNATLMSVNVYRAENTLGPGETRLFAQIAPFGSETEVSNENSLVTLPGPGGVGFRIFVENNYGYSRPSDVLGTGVTKPGLARVDVLPSGDVWIGSRNHLIRIPSVVTKASFPSNTVFTYNKQVDGWYLTALDGDDLYARRFSLKVGPGLYQFNNHYSALSLAPDNRTVWIGTLFGITRITVVR